MKKSTAVYIDPPGELAPQQKRTRNGAATKAAILDAALHAFCEHGFDGVGLREIAKGAGVTAVLVNRYFGTKENLFSATVDVAFDGGDLLTSDASTLAQHFAAHMVAKTGTRDGGPDGLLLLLRSSGSPRAAEILKAAIERTFATPLQGALKGPDAALRAALFLSQIAGVQLMRQVIGLDALRKVGERKLARRLAKMFEQQLADIG